MPLSVSHCNKNLEHASTARASDVRLCFTPPPFPSSALSLTMNVAARGRVVLALMPPARPTASCDPFKDHGRQPALDSGPP